MYTFCHVSLRSLVIPAALFNIYMKTEVFTEQCQATFLSSPQVLMSQGFVVIYMSLNMYWSRRKSVIFLFCQYSMNNNFKFLNLFISRLLLYYSISLYCFPVMIDIMECTIYWCIGAWSSDDSICTSSNRKPNRWCCWHWRLTWKYRRSATRRRMGRGTYSLYLANNYILDCLKISFVFSLNGFNGVASYNQWL